MTPTIMHENVSDLQGAIENKNFTESDVNVTVTVGDGNNENNNLSATITSIRSNVTRVLNMYFQNVSDEYGYGAATTTTTMTTTTVGPSTIGTATATLQQEMVSPIIETIKPPKPNEVVANFNISDAIRDSITAATKQIKTHFVSTAENALDALSTAASNATTISNSKTENTWNETAAVSPSNVLTTAQSITYPSYPIRSYENCSALFANYTQPQQGIFCNWIWDQYLCWPPTPAGVLARMHCPSGIHGIDTKKFANRKCEFDGHWGHKPNESYSPMGWTDYQPCFKPEVNELMQMTNLDLYVDIARRTRTLEIVGLVISLFALILSLIIFCNFRSLRNNRTKIHKNLFIAMVFQVIIRLTLYLDQAFRRGRQEAVTNVNVAGIENTPYLCEASYVLLEYARTAMFMWMFIEGLYLHNMVTVAVFQGRFPHTIFSLIGWGMPVLMTTVWALCTAAYMDSAGDCWWNYNLTPYYWILEGPRLVVILTNFCFLINIIRVLVVKLRQSQASDIEQTRKAVRAAIVLLPLLGITNLLYLVPDLKTPWKFALWSYVTHFLTSFQGFFIALIYCFLNGEVRAVLLKSLTVYMSVRGHPEWVPKRASMFSGAYNTAPDTEAGAQDGKRNDSPPNKRQNTRKASTTSTAAVLTSTQSNSRTHIMTRLANGNNKRRRSSSAERCRLNTQNNNNNNGNGNGNDNGTGISNSNINGNANRTHTRTRTRNGNDNGRRRSSSSGSGSGSSNRNNGSWIWSLCIRGGHKVLRVPTDTIPPESVVFELSEQ